MRRWFPLLSMRTVSFWPIEHLLIAGYIFLIPISWSPFPWNIQWSEFLFIGLFIYALTIVDFKTYTFHPIDLLVILYFLGPIFSLARTSEFVQSSIQYTKHLYLALVYGVFCVIASRRGCLAKIVSWFSMVASFLAAIGILAVMAYYLWDLRISAFGQPMPIPYLGEIFRLRGTFHSWEFFGNYLTFTLPLLVGLAMESEQHSAKQWWRFSIVLVVMAEIFTVSHSLAGMLAAGLFCLWRVWTDGSFRLLRMALTAMFLLVLVGVNLVLVVSVREVRYEFGTNPAIEPPSYVYAFHDSKTGAQMVTVTVSYNFMSYYLLKGVALEAFWREPLTGVGLGRFHEETDRAYQEGKIHAAYRYMDPHSTLPGRLAETGVFGGITLILLWVGFVFLGMKLLKRANREAWMIRAILAGIIGLLINSVNVDIMNFRFLWVGFALVRGMLPRMVSSDTGTLRMDRSGRSEAGYAPGS